MTLDETIKRFEALAESYESYVENINPKELAEWLKELKERREADVQPIRRGHWIEKVSYSGWGVSIYTCSECENAETIPSKFCPNCGADLREIENG